MGEGRGEGENPPNHGRPRRFSYSLQRGLIAATRIWATFPWPCNPPSYKLTVMKRNIEHNGNSDCPRHDAARDLIALRFGRSLAMHVRPRRSALLGLFFVLATVALAVSCANDYAGRKGPDDQPGTAPPTPAPNATSSLGTPPTAIRPVPEVVTVEASDEHEGTVLPRHDGVFPANRGDQYVFGELSVSGDCLRVSYADQTDREATRDGLLVVWPAGFASRLNGGVVEVTGTDGRVVAKVGQTVRLSGKKVSHESESVGEWDWVGGEAGQCGGPFWLVGDEVTAMAPGASGIESDDSVFLPRLDHQRGPIVQPSAGVDGRLALHGRCLLLETSHPPGGYLVVWPPGFVVQRIRDDLYVLNGGGNVVARIGDDVKLGGRSSKAGSNYPGECPGAYFKAYNVRLIMPGQNAVGR